jgi:hypothetical protein
MKIDREGKLNQNLHAKPVELVSGAIALAAAVAERCLISGYCSYNTQTRPWRSVTRTVDRTLKLRRRKRGAEEYQTTNHTLSAGSQQGTYLAVVLPAGSSYFFL